MNNLLSEICIVGAGPAGAAAALKLSYLDIPCLLLDKATFPRDKVCGDAISGKVTTLLNRLDPAILERLMHQTQRLHPVWGIEFGAPNGYRFDLPFKTQFDPLETRAPGFTMTRVHFDHFLIQQIKRRDSIDFRPGLGIKSYQRTNHGYVLHTDQGQCIETKLLLIADGANSRFSRIEAGLSKDSRHHAGGVRAYFKHVRPRHTKGFIELHFLEGILPGYFWIFPITDDLFNVGLGMRTDIIKKKQVNLKNLFNEIVQTHPQLKARFAEAQMVGNIKGYGLPLGSKNRPISGDHFMLLGDAGFLIDPLTGEGIGNAFYSGFIAAEQAAACLKENRFTAEVMSAYDQRVRRVLGKEMKLSYQLQQLLRSKGLANWLGKTIANNPKLIEFMSEMYTDIDLRRKLVRPEFWVRYLFG